MSAELIRQGKALVLAIQGLLALDKVGMQLSGEEREQRLKLLNLYQQALRALITDSPPGVASEILALLKTGPLPPFNAPGES